MSQTTLAEPNQQDSFLVKVSAFAKRAVWALFALLAISAIVSSSLPILKPTNPMHDLLYSQRWMLFPHMIAGFVVMIIGPFQFSMRLRQRNPSLHRLLGKIYIGGVGIAACMGPMLAWHYPAFFPYTVTTNGIIWLVTTGAAYYTARNRRFEQHRRWMTRSYAMVATFILPRVPVPSERYNNMSLEASSYTLLLFTVFVLVMADLISDLTIGKPQRSAARSGATIAG